MKMTEEQFSEMLVSKISDTVTPALEKQKEDLSKEIDAKVKELIAVETKAPRVEMKENLEDDPKGGFKSMGHFFRDVVRCDKSGGRTLTKELENFERISKAAGTGLSEGDGQYAGHLVPVEFRNTLWTPVLESNDIMPRCTTIPMGSNILEIPLVYGFDKSAGLVFGGIQWYWTDELGEYTASRPRVEKITMKLDKLTGLCYLSDELIEDSPQSVQALVQTGFKDGMNFKLNNGFIRGTGAGTLQGVLNSPALVTISAEAGQPANTILFENVIKAVARFHGTNGMWLANPNCLPQLASMSMLIGGAGVPVFMPAGGVSGQPYSTLFGMPLVYNDHCSSLGTTGDLILGDWSQYWIGRKSGSADVKYSESMHVMFLYDQQTLKFSTRLTGQCPWPTVMTPPQATSDTKSPFVVIATRS